MNLANLEKIEALIKASAILNESEKAEWLVLLNVMNDKQVAELEKILYSEKGREMRDKEKTLIQTKRSIPSGIVTPQEQAGKLGVSKTPSVASDATSPQQPSSGHQMATFPQGGKEIKNDATGEKNKVLRGMPKLAHIVNLPNNFNHRNFDAKEQKMVPLASPDGLNVSKFTKPSLAKPQSAFLTRLKGIFAEKELIAGKPENELSLPIQITPKKPLPPTPGINPPSVKISAQTKVKPAPPIPSLPKAKMPTAKPVALSAVLGTGNPRMKTPAPASDNTMPGIHFEQPAEHSKSNSLNLTKANLQKSDNLPGGLSNKPSSAREPALDKLEDLALLDYSILQNNDLDKLLQKVHPLVAKFDYFDVIFNLEKSPIFSSYLATGQKLLAEQIDFEDLSAKAKPGQYLSREQFEKFTDLLTRLQLG